MAAKLEKFATQLESEVLAALKKYSEQEGRKIQSVVNSALKQYLGAQGKPQARQHVMDAYLKSTEQFDGLYKELAK
jgi:hypothetical protein